MIAEECSWRDGLGILEEGVLLVVVLRRADEEADAMRGEDTAREVSEGRVLRAMRAAMAVSSMRIISMALEYVYLEDCSAGE